MKFQISNFKFQIIFLCILLLAAFLRLYQLGSNPPSLDWDETSLGYNAYSLLKTGRDEFGRAWPISIRSFEDYKPAAYAYFTIPTVALFGLNEFAVRLPSAILGVLTVAATYYLVKQWFGIKTALITSLLLTISPWHLQFSRVAFEANVALFFVTGGLLFFRKGLEESKWLVLSSIFFVLSFYTYHSPRLVVPLLIFGFGVYYRKHLWFVKKWVITSVIVGLIILMPFIREFLVEGRARFGSVTILTPEERLEESIKRIEYDQIQGDRIGRLLHNRRLVYGMAIIKGYLDHFNLDFLFLTGDLSDRHHAQDMGLLYLWEAPFIVLGALVLIKKRNLPLFWWFFIVPAASALTKATPHAVRALLYLPIYQIFTASGLIVLTDVKYQASKTHRLMLMFTILVFATVNIFYYLQMYYVHTPIEAARAWQYGYKQTVSEINKHESEVERIIMTYRYDQPHIYVLFYNKIDPFWYQAQVSGIPVLRSERRLGKYEFRNIDWETDKQLQNILLVGTPNEIPSTDNLVREIYFPDGSVAFRIIKL